MCASPTTILMQTLITHKLMCLLIELIMSEPLPTRNGSAIVDQQETVGGGPLHTNNFLDQDAENTGLPTPGD
jgi:hypothetical protein